MSNICIFFSSLKSYLSKYSKIKKLPTGRTDGYRYIDQGGTMDPNVIRKGRILTPIICKEKFKKLTLEISIF